MVFLLVLLVIPYIFNPSFYVLHRATPPSQPTISPSLPPPSPPPPPPSPPPPPTPAASPPQPLSDGRTDGRMTDGHADPRTDGRTDGAGRTQGDIEYPCWPASPAETIGTKGGSPAMELYGWMFFDHLQSINNNSRDHLTIFFYIQSNFHRPFSSEVLSMLPWS